LDQFGGDGVNGRIRGKVSEIEVQIEAGTSDKLQHPETFS